MTYQDDLFASVDAEPVILATLGDSELSHFVLATAVRLARSMPRAALHLVHALPTGVATATDVPGSLLQALGQDRVSSRAEAMSAALNRHVDSHLEYGPAAAVIVALASRLNADFIVIGSTDVGPVRRLLFGSVADEVLRKSPCSVVLARPRAS